MDRRDGFKNKPRDGCICIPLGTFKVHTEENHTVKKHSVQEGTRTVQEGVLVQGEERLNALGHVERRQVKVAIHAHTALAVPLVGDQAHDVVPEEVLVRQQ